MTVVVLQIKQLLLLLIECTSPTESKEIHQMSFNDKAETEPCPMPHFEVKSTLHTLLNDSLLSLSNVGHSSVHLRVSGPIDSTVNRKLCCLSVFPSENVHIQTAVF